VQTTGKSPDQEVNAEWHCDLVELSSRRLAALARTVFCACEKGRVLQKQVQQLVAKAVGNNWIKPSKLKRKLRDKVVPLVSTDSDGQS